MNEMQKKERRQFIRLEAYHLAKYKIISDDTPNAAYVLATIRDISAGGACLVAEEKLTPSTILELKINFPHLPEPVSCRARVAWTKQLLKSRSFESGLQFIELDEATRKIIDEHVKFVYEHLQRHKKKKSFFSFLFKGGEDV